MAKNNLLSISEFSKFTGMSRSKLIYYDDIGLFPPTERGENNYRYYALNQVFVAKFLDELVSFGLPLKALVELSQKRTPELIREILHNERANIQEKIQDLQETQRLMDVMTLMIDEGLKANEDEISIVEFDAFNLIVGPENVYQDAGNFYPTWFSFLANAQKQGLNLKFPVGGMFDTAEHFFESPGMPEHFYFINPIGKDQRQPGKYLVGYTRGFYGELGSLPDRLKKYAKKHKLKLVGPVYNPYLHDEISIADPHNFLMRVAIKIDE